MTHRNKLEMPEEITLTIDGAPVKLGRHKERPSYGKDFGISQSDIAASKQLANYLTENGISFHAHEGAWPSGDTTIPYTDSIDIGRGPDIVKLLKLAGTPTIPRAQTGPESFINPEAGRPLEA